MTSLIYVNSQHFLMLVLGCTLFPPIYRRIENWDFESFSRLDFPIFAHDERGEKLKFSRLGW